MIQIHEATITDSDRIRNAAHRDGAAPIASTHWIEKEGEVVGAVSLGVVKQTFIWIGKKLRARDSRRIEQFIVDESKRQGHTILSIAVDSQSKMVPYMEKLGYIPFGEVKLFIKPLQ